MNVPGLITGGWPIFKSNNGTLVLANGSNDFTGDITISDGIVRASADGALGTAAGGTTVNSGGTLEFDGAFNYTVAEPISIAGSGEAGIGALNNRSGDTTIDLGITFNGNTIIGSSADKFTINSAIDLGIFQDLGFTGSGDIEITQAFGNGGVTTNTANALMHYGYHINNDSLALDLNNNGGMMGGGDPTSFQSFNNGVLLTDGPGNRGLDFNNDTDFMNSGAIGQYDNYSNLWVSTLHVSAAQAGFWDFRNAGDDDRAGIWLDLDQDGVFESSTPGLGSNRGEQLSWEDMVAKTVNLAEGDYMIAFTHREGGGGSRVDFRVKSPLMGIETVIKPTDPSQNGFFSTQYTPNNDVTKSGSGTVTFYGNNTYSGETTISEGILVIEHDNALGTTDGNTTVRDGASLALTGGISIPASETLIIGDSAAGSVEGLVNLSGLNFYNGDIAVTNRSNGDARIRCDAGTLTVTGDIDLAYSSLTVSGAGNTTLNGNISGIGIDSSSSGGLPGNYYSLDANGVPNSTVAREALLEPTASTLDAPDALNIDALVPVDTLLTPWVDFGAGTEVTAGDGSVLNRGATGGNPFAGLANDMGNVAIAGMGNDRIAGVWSGHINIPTSGDYAFTTRSDDGSVLYIDGVLVVDNNYHQGMTNRSGTASLTAGFHTIKVAYFENTGGAGIQASWDPLLVGRRIIEPDVLYTVFLANNQLIKTGLGILELGGTNTYNGGTTVSEGTLLVDNTSGSGTGPGTITVQSGAVFGGTGTASGNFTLQDGGILAPGISPGVLSTGDVFFDNGSTLSMELTNTPAVGPHDQLDVTGSVALESSGSGVALDLDTTLYSSEAGTITIINNDGSDPVVGTFAGLAEGGLTNFGSTPNFRISYVGGDGNDVELTVVGPTAITLSSFNTKIESGVRYIYIVLLIIMLGTVIYYSWKRRIME